MSYRCAKQPSMGAHLTPNRRRPMPQTIYYGTVESLDSASRFLPINSQPQGSLTRRGSPVFTRLVWLTLRSRAFRTSSYNSKPKSNIACKTKPSYSSIRNRSLRSSLKPWKISFVRLSASWFWRRGSHSNCRSWLRPWELPPLPSK